MLDIQYSLILGSENQYLEASTIFTNYTFTYKVLVEEHRNINSYKKYLNYQLHLAINKKIQPGVKYFIL